MVNLTDEDFEDVIIRAYEYMYSELNSYSDYQYTPSLLDHKIVENFIAHIRAESHRVNVEYVLNFIENSFGYYAKSKAKYKYGLRGVMLSWVIGKQAIKRTETLQDDYPNFPQFLRFMRTRVKASLYGKFAVETNTKITKRSDEKYIELNEVEEKFKALCPDGDLILIHCTTGTTLYNHRSTKCVFCPSMKECKALLKASYPKINKLRGY